eukprot:295221-Amphidinium_carterae.3
MQQQPQEVQRHLAEHVWHEASTLLAARKDKLSPHNKHTYKAQVQHSKVILVERVDASRIPKF